MNVGNDSGKNVAGNVAQVFLPGNWNTLPKLAAVITGVTGLIVLAGWIFSIPLLKSVLPGAVEMKANTAIGLVLSALALFILSHRPSQSQRLLAQALGLSVTALGLATLGEYLFGWQLGIDELLFRDTADAAYANRGRMSPYSAIVFAMIGLALTAMPWRSVQLLRWLLSIFVIVIGAISFLGYLWNAAELVTDRFLPPVAVHTAIAFVLLGIGIFSSNWESEQRPMIRTSVELRILAGFIGAFVLLVLVGGYTYQKGAEYENSAQMVEHTQAVRAALGKLYGAVSDVEASQRSYILTGNKSYLEEYKHFVAEVSDDQLNLARLIADNPAQAQNTAALGRLIVHRIDMLEKNISIFEQHGYAAATAAISSDDGIQTKQAIRNLTNRMDNAEMGLLSTRNATLTHSRELTLVALLVTLAFTGSILATLFLGIRREIYTRAQAERRLAASEENLSVTLNSIGDGVIATDTEGRITRLNVIAEQLTGWPRAEAIGRPVDDVFHIINQKTRRLATIPVAATLTEGVIQGLANDTVLIARDGCERPIADSCAPIRNRDGDVIGAVLAFRDVTEEYAAKIALRDSEERYRTLFESVDEGFCVVEMLYDPDGKAVDYRFVEINPAFEQQTGLHQALGKTIRELVPDHDAHWFEIYGNVARTGEAIRFKNPAKAMQRHYDVFAFRVGGDGSRRVGILFKDITENKLAEQALIAAKEQAERASLAKDSFLTTMSHEIRTPLTGMLGMLELLSMSSLGNEQRSTLNAAWDSARGLLRIVSDILDWSKIEEGKLTLSPRSTSIPHLLQEVVNTYSRVASAKSLILRQHADARLSAAHIVDPLRLSQVLNNFVSNAIKFTEHGEIVLRAELLDRLDSGERIRFSVKDTGKGIAKDVQQHLFQRYRQESADTARMYGGTGLGLAICRRLVELIDGQIELESAPGQGSTFSITLVLPTSGMPEELLQTRNLTVEQRKIEPLHDGGADAPLVLVVDDHSINRKLLAHQINLLGLRTEIAENGEVALSIWRNGRFTLVITDCHMPEMDGYAFTRRVREIEAEERRPRTPIIAWTANALADETAACRNAGMDELLVKPTDLKKLRETIAKWLPIAEVDEPVAPARGIEPPTC